MDLGDGKTAVFLIEGTIASVAMCWGVKPASPRIIDSAIEKQPAWAAAISSSGLMPGAPSKRVRNLSRSSVETGRIERPRHLSALGSLLRFL